MAVSIESITDRKLFKNILDRFFFNRISFIHDSDGNMEVKFLESSGGLVKLHVPYLTKEPKNCMAFTRHENNIIFVFLKLCEKERENILIFNPTKFQVVTTERKDERKYLKSSNDKSLIYITNVISEVTILNSLNGQGKTLERIKEIINYDNMHEYEYLKIYFCNEGIDDARMKYFYNNRMPIFITDINSQDNQGSDKYTYYRNTIYNADSYLNNHKDLISEISVPILFSSKIPYGYVQINKSSAFPASAVQRLARLASLIDDLAKKNKLFSASGDKLPVSDISKNGIGIVFKDKKYIPYYKKDSYVSMDMILPLSKKASILADVRHLEMMQNRIIKVGFEIREMDKASKDNYERFLGSINA